MNQRFGEVVASSVLKHRAGRAYQIFLTTYNRRLALLCQEEQNFSEPSEPSTEPLNRSAVA
jgi:hypothetical protein